MVKNDHTESAMASGIGRRNFLRATGAGATLTAFAGCMGGDGGDGGGDGGSGDGGDGGSTGGGGDLETITFATPPVGLPVELAFHYMEQDGQLQDIWAEYGYELDYQLTFEDATLFASGQVQFDTVSYFEGARMGLQQDIDLVSFGFLEAVTHGLQVKIGGPYDPEVTGSPQASVDKMVEDQARFAILSWAGGSTPWYKTIMDRVYGYEMAQDGGDINVFTTDYGQMPPALMDEEVAMAGLSPSSAGQEPIANGDIRPLQWVTQEFHEQGWGMPPLVSLTTRRSTLEEHPGAAKALLESWNLGLSSIHENADEIESSSWGQEMLSCETETQAKYIMDLFVRAEGAIEPLVTLDDAGITEEDIAGFESVMDLAVEVGEIDSSWSDHMEFMTASEVENL